MVVRVRNWYIYLDRIYCLVNEPFPCGLWSDGCISYEYILSILEPWEFYITDKGCGSPYSINLSEQKHDPFEKMMAMARA